MVKSEFLKEQLTKSREQASENSVRIAALTKEISRLQNDITQLKLKIGTTQSIPTYEREVNHLLRLFENHLASVEETFGSWRWRSGTALWKLACRLTKRQPVPSAELHLKKTASEYSLVKGRLRDPHEVSPSRR